MKKNNKGFTLVELIAVLSILAIILAIAIPYGLRTQNEQNEKMYNIEVEEIKSAAKGYVTENINSLNLNEPGDSVNITLEMLYNEGFIQGIMVDPRNNKPIDEGFTVTATLDSNNKINYSYINLNE